MCVCVCVCVCVCGCVCVCVCVCVCAGDSWRAAQMAAEPARRKLARRSMENGAGLCQDDNLGLDQVRLVTDCTRSLISVQSKVACRHSYQLHRHALTRGLQHICLRR